MEKSFRKSMSWLHTWSGLILGWLLFAIFVTGTSSYYRGEISLFMQPETHKSKANEETFDIAIDKAIEATKTSNNVFVALPNSRSNLISISSQNINAKKTKKDLNKKRKKRRFVSKYYDASTGELIKPRRTAGGTFLYRFHYQLYGIPKDIARWIVGIATMTMLVAIITGIIIHKRIFKDIFVFRSKNNARGWMDAHILPAVATLPFLIMITYSGLLLFKTILMPWGINFYYDNYREYKKDLSKLYASSSTQTTIPKAITIKKKVQTIQRNNSITKEQLLKVFQKANTYYPDNIGSFSIRKSTKSNLVRVNIKPKNPSNIFNFKREQESITFDLHSTKLIKEITTPKSNNMILNINSIFTSLHLAHFADSTLRFIFFLSGVFGIVISGTGLILWIEKRKKKYENKKSFGFWLVDKLNIGTIVGIFIAIGVYFIANRVISATDQDRVSLEISAFFIAWLLSYIYGFIRNSKRAWIEQFIIAAIIYLSIPILNNLLWLNDISFFDRDSIFIYMDLFFVSMSMVFATVVFILTKRLKKGEKKWK